MARKKNKTLWVLLVTFLMFGSSLGYVLWSRGATPQPQEQKIPESLIVNFSLPQDTEARVLQSGFTIVRLLYTPDCNCSDFIKKVENIQQHFNTTGGYKQILLEEIPVDSLNTTGTISIEVRSLRGEAILNTTDEQVLITKLCNITWDPPVEYCLKI
ncbi:MAG: hypothetical protein B6U68_00710 [Candidatus Aenigmarchaeota archaeon ex4484_14]|nr:MAG: hypothetical protein B6U68_00710 [Candidatus Aenigmarchaeota archaeon ex4484_14]